MAGQIFFEKLGNLLRVTPRIKNFVEIVLSNTVFEIQAFLKKIRKFKIATILWQVKYSLKLEKASLHRYTVGKKIFRNRSIWQGFRDTSIFGFVIFAKNLKIQNGHHFLASEIFVEIGKG